MPPASPTRNTSLDHWEIDTGLVYRVPPSVCAVYLGTHISVVESEGKSLRLALPLPLTSLEMHAFLVSLILFFFKAMVRSTQSICFSGQSPPPLWSPFSWVSSKKLSAFEGYRLENDLLSEDLRGTRWQGVQSLLWFNKKIHPRNALELSVVFVKQNNRWTAL